MRKDGCGAPSPFSAYGYDLCRASGLEVSLQRYVGSEYAFEGLAVGCLTVSPASMASRAWDRAKRSLGRFAHPQEMKRTGIPRVEARSISMPTRSKG